MPVPSSLGRSINFCVGLLLVARPVVKSCTQKWKRCLGLKSQKGLSLRSTSPPALVLPPGPRSDRTRSSGCCQTAASVSEATQQPLGTPRLSPGIAVVINLSFPSGLGRRTRLAFSFTGEPELDWLVSWSHFLQEDSGASCWCTCV